MLVYRLENSNKDGIYSIYCIKRGVTIGGQCDKFTIMDREDFDNYSKLHPCPNEDGNLGKWWKKAPRTVDYSCGFADEKQMLEWFPIEGFRKMIKLCDEICNDTDFTPFQVYVYKVDGRKVKKGNSQVVFNMNDAVLVDFYPLQKYANMKEENVY